jgi:hypothetical protein
MACREKGTFGMACRITQYDESQLRAVLQQKELLDGIFHGSMQWKPSYNFTTRELEYLLLEGGQAVK